MLNSVDPFVLICTWFMYILIRMSELLFVEGFRTQHWLFGCLAESTGTSAVALLSTHTPPPAPDAHYTSICTSHPNRQDLLDSSHSHTSSALYALILWSSLSIKQQCWPSPGSDSILLDQDQTASFIQPSYMNGENRQSGV